MSQYHQERHNCRVVAGRRGTGWECSESVRVDIELDETTIKRCSADPQSFGSLGSVAVRV